MADSSIPSTRPAGPVEPPGNGAIPPLENGDRLTRDEFERRYDAMPGLKNAELIEGVVYLRLRTRHRQHAAPHAKLVGWLGYYAAGTPGVEPGSGSHVRLDRVNMPQPDALLLIQPEYRGQARIDEEDYIAGAPELVAEVVSSRASYDLYEKLGVYLRHGVRECIVWRVLDEEVDWFVNREGVYLPLCPGPDRILRSTIFPGLWLDPSALIRGDVNGVLAVVRQGLNSPEHAEFVARLERDRED
jgi:Uma2 family endonuclease